MGRKLKTSRAELPLATEINLPKKSPKGKNTGRKSGYEPRLRLKALPTGLYNVIENRLLLK